MASEMLLKNLVTMKAKNQLKVAAAELAVDLISGTEQEKVNFQVVNGKLDFYQMALIQTRPSTEWVRNQMRKRR